MDCYSGNSRQKYAKVQRDVKWISKITEIPDEYLGIYSENSRAVAAGDLRILDLIILVTESDTFANKLCQEKFPSKHKFLVLVTKGWASNSVNRLLSILVLKYSIPVYLASDLDFAGCEMGHCYSKGKRVGIEQTEDKLEQFYIPILK